MNIKKWLIYKILRASLWHGSFFLQNIKNMIDDHYYDKKFGIETDEFVVFKNTPESFQEGVYKDGVIFQSSHCQKLRQLVNYLKLDDNDVFMDFGAGKGRAIFFVAQQKLKKVIGIELKKELVEIAFKNRSRLELPTTVEIIHGDAANVDVHEGTVFFFSNPFGPMTFIQVLNNIKKSLKSNPKKIRIVYFNSIYAHLLDSQDWLKREWIMTHDRFIVWSNINQHP